jgi:membrane protein DedA with SNARE-associated domain
MEQYIHQLVEQLSAVDPGWAYLALLVSAFLENVVPPVPGDTVVVFSAYLVGRGTLSLWPVYAATCVGGTAGFMTMYAIGWTQGRAFLHRRHLLPFTATNLPRAERWLQRHGLLLILGNRFLSGVRTGIAISAGIGRLGWRRVALAAALSMALWNAALLSVGVALGRNWSAAIELLKSYNRALLALLALALAFYVLRRLRRRRGAATQTET